MVSKYLKRKLKLGKEDDSFYYNPMELEYYLTESRIDYRDELYGEKVYGISIVKRTNDICLEENFIPNFSCCINETGRVIEKLANNAVTPIGLEPVLDDLLGS